ncbi:MAG: efflux RND transporter periplasmic adaptor subunit [Proteobacteria bacterium]|nr:efflux RND transporter periplasmic adaptor subunit [Pseudomonadota bacterium]
MGTNLDPVSERDEPRADSVTWIGRERGTPAASAPPPLTSAPQQQDGGGRRRQLLVAAAIAVALALGAAWWMKRGSNGPAATIAATDQQTRQTVSVVSPGKATVSSSVSLTGAIAARYDMPIGNEGDTGRVIGVYAEAGDKVKRGQILARLDDAVLVQQVNRLAASLEQARAQAALSAAEYRRAQGVEAAGALSAEDIEKRRATSVTDAANVKVVAAQLAEAQARLGRARITAPVDGTVLTRNAEVGQIVNPGGEPLFRVASGGEVEMRAQIAEQDLAQIRTGQAATVYLTGLSQPFEGQVRLLGAVIDPKTRLGDIRIRLKPDPALRPGAFARAVVMVGKAQRVVVPQTAVMSDAKGSFVYVAGEGDRIERRAVTVAGVNEQGAIIASGLSGAERVVASAGGFLREGEIVRVAAP